MLFLFGYHVGNSIYIFFYSILIVSQTQLNFRNHLELVKRERHEQGKENAKTNNKVIHDRDAEKTHEGDTSTSTVSENPNNSSRKIPCGCTLPNGLESKRNSMDEWEVKLGTKKNINKDKDSVVDIDKLIEKHNEKSRETIRDFNEEDILDLEYEISHNPTGFHIAYTASINKI